MRYSGGLRASTLQSENSPRISPPARGVSLVVGSVRGGGVQRGQRERALVALVCERGAVREVRQRRMRRRTDVLEENTSARLHSLLFGW